MADVADLTVRYRSVGMGDVVRDAERGESALQKFGQGAAKVGRSMTLGITLPFVAVSGAAFKWASDVEEATNMTNVVFGESAKGMTDWAATGAEAFGLSSSEALRAAGSYGTFFKAAGVGADELVKKAEDMTQLGGDLASFWNTTAEEANAAIMSGLSGESEPLRKYGVFLTEAKVQAKALEMGLVGVNEELTEQDKILAREAIIWEETTDAQGDYAETAGSAANMTRTFQKQVQNLGAEFGKVLLPVGVKVLGFLGGWLTRLGKLSPAMKTTALVVAAVVAAIGPLLIVFGKLATSISAISTLFGAGGALSGLGGAMLGMLGPIALLVAAGAGLFFAWRSNFLGIRDLVDSVFGGILDGVGEFVGDIGDVGLADAIRGIGGDETPAFLVHLADWVDRVSAFVGETIAFFDELRGRGFGPIESASIAFGNALDRLLGTNLSPFFTDLGQWLGATVLMVTLTAGYINDTLIPSLTLLAEFSFAELMDWLAAIVLVLSLTLPGLVQGLAFGWLVAWASMKKMVLDVMPLLDVLVPGALHEIGIQLSNLVTLTRMFVFGLDTAGGLIRSTFGVGGLLAKATADFVNDIATGLDLVNAAMDRFSWAKLTPPAEVTDFWGILGASFSQTPAGDVADIFGGIDDLFGGGGEASAAEAPGGGQAITDAILDPFNAALAELPTVLGSIHTEILTNWLGIKDMTAVQFFNIKNEAENQLVALRNEATLIAFDLRNNVANEFNGLQQDAHRLTELFFSVVTTNFRLAQTEVERIAFGIRNTVVNQLVGLRNDAAGLAGSIGRAIGGGIWAGMSIWAGPIAALAAGMVRGAINAARAEAQVSSPSKKTMYIGEMMAAGLMIPLRQAERDVQGLLGGAFGARGAALAAGGVPARSGGGIGPGGATYITAYLADNYDWNRLVEEKQRSYRVGGARS